MSTINIKHLITFSLALVLLSCKQSNPPLKPIIEDTTYDSTIFFSGIKWYIKSGLNNKLGPGPNYFSNSSKNVFLDNSGNLHLKITNENGKWNCAEVISKDFFGYGTYVFKLISNVADIEKNVVYGFFTWDNNSFLEQANSEVDIEFSKWGKSSDSLTLTQSVQPVWFNIPAPYIERTNHPQININKIRFPSSHAFTWTDSLITWKSYEGTDYPGTNLIASWRFDKNNQARTKLEGGKESNPIVIPKPGSDTHARINLWLLNGIAPSDNKEVELIVKEFKFIP
jgi:hypothetical protein